MCDLSPSLTVSFLNQRPMIYSDLKIIWLQVAQCPDCQAEWASLKEKIQPNRYEVSVRSGFRAILTYWEVHESHAMPG